MHASNFGFMNCLVRFLKFFDHVVPDLEKSNVPGRLRREDTPTRGSERIEVQSLQADSPAVSPQSFAK
jgi:hypothetical protein